MAQYHPGSSTAKPALDRGGGLLLPWRQRGSARLERLHVIVGEPVAAVGVVLLLDHDLEYPRRAKVLYPRQELILAPVAPSGT